MRTLTLIAALAFAAGCNTPPPAPKAVAPTPKPTPVAVAPAPLPPAKPTAPPFACPGPFSDCADVMAASPTKAASAPAAPAKGKTPDKVKTGKTG